MAGLSCAIVGLPNVGKSTLFNALTSSEAAAAANYPFCTIDPNVGLVEVPDPRLAVLSKLSGSKKIIPASMEFVDIAGLVAGASSGEGLGNKFLAHIRETDAIAQVVRCFDDDDITHVSGSVDPIRDIQVIDLELTLADLQMCQNVLQRLNKKSRLDKEMQPTIELLTRIEEALNAEQSVRSMGLTDEEEELLGPYPFLTAKKVMFIANVSDADLPEMDNQYVQALKKYAEEQNSFVVPICARLEEEISQCDQEERLELLGEFGFEESGLERLIKAAYALLGLSTFLTTGEMETRAWTIPQNALAPEAAGKIHTDIQNGFIRAEIVSYSDMVDCGSRANAREQGKLRVEGKEYAVQDGDVINFLHN